MDMAAVWGTARNATSASIKIRCRILKFEARESFEMGMDIGQEVSLPVCAMWRKQPPRQNDGPGGRPFPPPAYPEAPTIATFIYGSFYS